MRKIRYSGDSTEQTTQTSEGVAMGIDVGSEINQIVSSLQRDNPELSLSARIKRAWNTSIDSRIAEHVTAVFVVPDTGASEVIVYVDNPIWTTELGMQVELLRSNLNLELNKNDQPIPGIEHKLEQVEKLTFKLSKEEYIPRERKITTLQQMQEEEKPYKEAQPVSLDDDELTSLNIAFSNIDDDELRETIYAAAKANLEWQKGIDKIGA